jgi:hypothetical protein
MAAKCRLVSLAAIMLQDSLREPGKRKPNQCRPCFCFGRHPPKPGNAQKHALCAVTLALSFAGLKLVARKLVNSSFSCCFPSATYTGRQRLRSRTSDKIDLRFRFPT